MPTNFDEKPCLATRGQHVRFKFYWEAFHQPEWQNIGIVRGIKLDKDLTRMNKINKQIYRILVDFGNDQIASMLPCVLEKVNESTR